MAQKDPVDVLRIKFWCEGLCLSLGVTTAYALEQRIAPKPVEKSGINVTTQRKKWMLFRRGMRTPNASTRAQADKLVAKSSLDLELVLWPTLRKEPLGADAEKLFGQLSPKLLVKFEGQDVFKIEGGHRILSKIERLASLDALAFLTILLRINYEQGRYDRAWDFAQPILRMLLILGELFDDRKIAKGLFDIYRERIFEPLKFNGEKLLLDEYEYLAYIETLRRWSNHMSRSAGHELGWDERVKLKRGILNGNSGIEFTMLFTAPISPDLDVGPPKLKSIKFWQLYILLQDKFRGLSGLLDR